MHAELCVDVLPVRRDRAVGEHELLLDVRGIAPLGKVHHDFELALRQARALCQGMATLLERTAHTTRHDVQRMGKRALWEDVGKHEVHGQGAAGSEKVCYLDPRHRQRPASPQAMRQKPTEQGAECPADSDHGVIPGRELTMHSTERGDDNPHHDMQAIER